MAVRMAKDVVILIAESADGEVIDTHEMPFDEFYDSDNKLIDSKEYRARRGIRRITGELFDMSGQLTQVFNVWYLKDGSQSRRRAVHADGTIIED